MVKAAAIGKGQCYSSSGIPVSPWKRTDSRQHRLRVISTAPVEEALELQRPLPPDQMLIVAKGERKDEAAKKRGGTSRV